MELIKKMIAAVMIITASNAAIAQDQKQEPQQKVQLTAEQRANKALERMTMKLNLTDVQKTKIRAVLVDRMQKRDVAMQKIKENKKAVHTAMKAENEESDKEILAVLDASQADKYNKMKALKRNKMQERKGKGEDAKPIQEPNN